MPIAVTLTVATQTLLDSMPALVRQFLEHYIDNPIFEKAQQQGVAQKLWLDADAARRFEFELTANGTLDIAFYKRHNNDYMRQTHYVEEYNVFEHWPPRRAQASNLEKAHYIIARLADSITMACSTNNVAQQKDTIEELSRQLPWFDTAYEVSKWVSPIEYATSLDAFTKNLRKWKLLDQTNVGALLSPGNAVHTLMTVYASNHRSAEPRLYALEKENEKPSFIFVKPKDVSPPKDTSIPEEIVMWFDSNGVLTAIAEQSRTCTCVYMADMCVHPDVRLKHLQWYPEENAFNGQTWDEAVQKNTVAIQPLLDQLAARTIRPLNSVEAVCMIEQWLTTSAAFLSMWENNDIMLIDHQEAVNLEKRIGTSLFSWSLWAKDLWSQAYPKQHAVLSNLLDDMVSPSTMQTWFEHMHRVSRADHYESFNIEQLVDPTP